MALFSDDPHLDQIIMKFYEDKIPKHRLLRHRRETIVDLIIRYNQFLLSRNRPDVQENIKKTLDNLYEQLDNYDCDFQPGESL
jgi:hypothetical protein